MTSHDADRLRRGDARRGTPSDDDAFVALRHANGVISHLRASATTAEPVVFHCPTSLLVAFRSTLCFWNDGDEDHPQVGSDAGAWAIQKFIEQAGECRHFHRLRITAGEAGWRAGVPWEDFSTTRTARRRRVTRHSSRA